MTHRYGNEMFWKREKCPFLLPSSKILHLAASHACACRTHTAHVRGWREWRTGERQPLENRDAVDNRGWGGAGAGNQL